MINSLETLFQESDLYFVLSILMIKYALKEKLCYSLKLSNMRFFFYIHIECYIHNKNTCIFCI